MINWIKEALMGKNNTDKRVNIAYFIGFVAGTILAKIPFLWGLLIIIPIAFLWSIIDSYYENKDQELARKIFDS
jgi:hypothetical protein